MIALVEGLLERIAVLEERVEALENQLSKNSRNSKQQVDDAKARDHKALEPGLVQWFEERYEVFIQARLAANPIPPIAPRCG